MSQCNPILSLTQQDPFPQLFEVQSLRPRTFKLWVACSN